MIRRITLLTVLSALTVLSGCASHHLGGAPEPSSNLNKDLAALETYYGQAAPLQEALKGDNEDTRNKFVTGRLVVMNLRYLRFVREVTANKQIIDSASDILVLSLNLAGTALGGEGTKTALAAISAGIAGSRIVVDKEFFYEKTMPALVAAMNASRREAILPILKGMRLSITEYPVAQAVTDLDAYYHAGTLIGAVNAITVEAGEMERDADIQIASLKAMQDLRTRVYAWINLNGASSARAKLKMWYEAIPSAPEPPKLQAAILILDRAVQTLAPAKIADALVDQTQRQTAIDLLENKASDRTSAMISTFYPPFTTLKISSLVDALEPGALSEILASDLLKDANILALK